MLPNMHTTFAALVRDADEMCPSPPWQNRYSNVNHNASLLLQVRNHWAGEKHRHLIRSMVKNLD